MDKMDKNSEPYKDGRYSDLFEAAESANVVGEDAVLYSQSLASLRAMKAGFEYRYEEGREEGQLRLRALRRRPASLPRFIGEPLKIRENEA